MQSKQHTLRIVIPHAAAWVLDKMGRKVAEHLPRAEWQSTLDACGSLDADINHWTHYMDAFQAYQQKRLSGYGGIVTFWITHVDDYYKLKMVKTLCACGGFGICLSSETVSILEQAGIELKQLTYVVPASDDIGIAPRISFGIASRYYADGRKNEKILLRLCDEIDIQQFEFRIWGSGWEKIVSLMGEKGAKVIYDPGTDDAARDYKDILRGLSSCDYCLYVGWDEGSLATIDAIKLGVKTIVSRQGYHMDLAPVIDYLFSDYKELKTIIDALGQRRKRLLEFGGSLSWPVYAGKHAEIWKHLIVDGRLPERANVNRALRQAPTLMSAVLNPRRTRWSFMRYTGIVQLKAAIRRRLRVKMGF
jgi:hypothetical protein